MTNRISEILSWYGSENVGVRTKLYTLLNTGNLAGTGKMVILPVDQGFEHGPTRSFASNPDAYDPEYHFKLAIASGCNAYAAPLGFLQACADKYAGQIPLILKVNNSESLWSTKAPCSSVTSSIQDALELGCLGIGYTIYPGSAERKSFYEDLRELTQEAKAAGLAVIVWAYPRGENISKEGETAVDVVSYSAHIAAQMGAHIIKVKPPTKFLEVPLAKKEYEKNNIPNTTLADQTRHVIQSAFNGKRIVIFSGGEAKDDPTILEETRQLALGGSFGAIVGRNAFQRPWKESLKLLHSIQEIYKG